MKLACLPQHFGTINQHNRLLQFYVIVSGQSSIGMTLQRIYSYCIFIGIIRVDDLEPDLSAEKTRLCI